MTPAHNDVGLGVRVCVGLGVGLADGDAEELAPGERVPEALGVRVLDGVGVLVAVRELDGVRVGVVLAEAVTLGVIETWHCSSPSLPSDWHSPTAENCPPQPSGAENRQVQGSGQSLVFSKH